VHIHPHQQRQTVVILFGAKFNLSLGTVWIGYIFNDESFLYHIFGESTIPTNDSTLPLCKVEETIDLEQVIWTDLTAVCEDNILDLGKASRTHVNSIYIRGILSFSGCRKFNVNCYVDTGASMCLANKNIIPPQFWQKTKELIYGKLADDIIHELNIVAEKIEILIQDKIFIIPTLYQTTTRYDILLGNIFYRLYEPFAQ